MGLLDTCAGSAGAGCWKQRLEIYGCFLEEAAKTVGASEQARHRAELVSFGMGSIVMLSSCRMLLNVCRSWWWRRPELFTSGPRVQPAQLEAGGVNGSDTVFDVSGSMAATILDMEVVLAERFGLRNILND